MRWKPNWLPEIANCCRSGRSRRTCSIRRRPSLKHRTQNVSSYMQRKSSYSQFSIAINGLAEKLRDEKFAKLVTVYKNLRGEHIELLRQKAETDKKLKETVQKCRDSEQCTTELQGKIGSMELELVSDQEKLREMSSGVLEELESLRRDKELFHMETEVLKKSAEDAVCDKNLAFTELETARQEKMGLNERLTDTTNTLLQVQNHLENGELLLFLNRSKNCFLTSFEFAKKKFELS